LSVEGRGGEGRKEREGRRGERRGGAFPHFLVYNLTTAFIVELCVV